MTNPQIAVEGEEEMSDRYWETIHVVANQALDDMLLENEDILVDTETDDIVATAYPQGHLEGLFPCSQLRYNLRLYWTNSYNSLGSSMVKCYVWWSITLFYSSSTSVLSFVTSFGSLSHSQSGLIWSLFIATRLHLHPQIISFLSALTFHILGCLQCIGYQWISFLFALH
jgi:hypothetical protein